MRVFLIAGEASGDVLGGALMAGLKTLAEEAGETVEFAGIGGQHMQAEGLDSLFAMQELSLMGLAEVLPKYFHLKRRIAETAEAALAFEPDVIITIDSPDFCLRVVQRVKRARAVPVVHYVAPQVWAWRPGRARRMARVVDHVLALFPFEPPYMEAAGMSCDFVGHPVVKEPQAGPEEVAQFRGAHGLDEAPLILALPGSRQGEIRRLGPVFGAALGAVLEARPEARVVVPAAQNMEAEVAAQVASWPGTPLVIPPGDAARRRAAFGAADAALAASGTVSLELAASRTPMIIAYDAAWLTMQIVNRLVLTDAVCLVNLVSGSRKVPEFIGARCRPELIAPALTGLLEDPGAQAEEMAAAMQALGAGGEAPGLRAARSVRRFLACGGGGLDEEKTGEYGKAAPAAKGRGAKAVSSPGESG